MVSRWRGTSIVSKFASVFRDSPHGRPVSSTRPHKVIVLCYSKSSNRSRRQAFRKTPNACHSSSEFGFM